MIGIYYWKNLITGEYYIGQSVNISKRKAQHLCDRKNEKYNHYPLYLSMNKYGVENFEFGVLEECSIEELDEKEVYYISQYNSYNNGFNQTTGGQYEYCGIGENNPRTKLTNEEVLKIRNRVYIEKEDIWDIYPEYCDKIGKDRFWSMVHGETWKNVDTSMIYPLKERGYANFKGAKNPKAKLTEDDVKSIRYRYEVLNQTVDEIYEDYRSIIMKKNLKNVITYTTWKNIHY